MALVKPFPAQRMRIVQTEYDKLDRSRVCQLLRGGLVALSDGYGMIAWTCSSQSGQVAVDKVPRLAAIILFHSAIRWENVNVAS